MIDKAIPQGQDGHLDHSQEEWLRLMPDGWDGTDYVDENDKLRELVRDMWSGMCGYAHDCRNCEHYELREGQSFVGKCEYCRRMCELGIEVKI